MISAKSRIGKKYGEIIIISVLPSKKNRRCVAKCSCGKVFKPYLQNVIRGQTKSCGKHKKEPTEKHLLRINNQAEYLVWLKHRKTLPKALKLSFKAFLIKFGKKPDPNFIFDGSDWVKRKSKKSKMMTFQGVTLNMSEWGKKLGRTREGVRQRLLKFPLEKALIPKLVQKI